MLGAAGQECALDPRDRAATVGGVLATGLSGHRRLRLGPLRDRVLEVRFVTADGRLVKAGGPTVKNVSGFDLPRLLVGSLGTIGVLVQVTLRCQPRPADVASGSRPTPTRSRCGARCTGRRASRGTARTTHVLLEGVAGRRRRRARARSARQLRRERGTGVARGRAPGPGLGAPVGAPRAGTRPRSRPVCAGWPRSASAPCTSRADDETALARRARLRPAAGRLAAPRGRRARPRRLRRRRCRTPRLADRVRAAFDPTGKCSPGRLPREPADD